MRIEPDNLFWRPNEPIRPADRSLWDLVACAHEKSALRNNASSMAVIASAQGSGDYTKAITAALMTLGKKHAPLTQTVELLRAGSPVFVARNILECGGTVPGWGSSFSKGQIDSDWLAVDEFVRLNYEGQYVCLKRVTNVLHEFGKNVYPNPSAYTAILAIVIGLPAGLEASLFLTMRLNAWTNIFWRASTRG